jgi:hypothetical protein
LCLIHGRFYTCPRVFFDRISQSAEALAKAEAALSSLALPASTASRPAFVTIASRPSVGRDGGGYIADLGKSRSGIFLQMGLDGQIGDLPVGQITLIRFNKSAGTRNAR